MEYLIQISNPIDGKPCFGLIMILHLIGLARTPGTTKKRKFEIYFRKGKGC